MAGSINSDSVIWVAGEATGRDASGATAAIPTSEDLTASGVSLAETQAELDALEARILASGILPSVSF